MTLVGTAAFFCGDRIRSASVATGGVDSGRAVCRSWRAIPAGFVRRRPQAACSGAMRAVDYGGPSQCCRGGSRCFFWPACHVRVGGALVPGAPANSLSLTAKGGSPSAESDVRQRTLRAAGRSGMARLRGGYSADRHKPSLLIARRFLNVAPTDGKLEPEERQLRINSRVVTSGITALLVRPLFMGAVPPLLG